MSPLNISKVAVGCSSLEALAVRQRLRVSDGEVPVFTRFRPKRADALIGGSLFWIIKHRLVARQTIRAFGEDASSRRTIIMLDARLVPVAAWPKRAHQGWRYLAAADAPPDLGSPGELLAEMPTALLSELTALALL